MQRGHRASRMGAALLQEPRDFLLLRNHRARPVLSVGIGYVPLQ
jgi:hypothetical protein